MLDHDLLDPLVDHSPTYLRSKLVHSKLARQGLKRCLGHQDFSVGQELSFPLYKAFETPILVVIFRVTNRMLPTAYTATFP